MSDETITLDWAHEHARFEREMYGLVRSIAFRAYKRARRPKTYWNSMAEDACIFAWRSFRSLRLRGLDPQDVGVYAIADRAVLSTLQGARFQPVGMGDRSHADSIHNKDNGLKVRSNREPWQLEGATGDGQEDSDVMADFDAWKMSLDDEERVIVERLEKGDSESLKAIKGMKKRKRLLADRFKAYRQG